MRTLLLFTAAAFAARAEVYTLSLKQAVARALTQNPDVVMARLDEMKALEGVRVAKDPFSVHFGVGSGLAYSTGFPLSIEGSAPAAFQAKASESLFNRPQAYAIAQARETARGAGFAAGERRDDVIYRIAALYIDVDRAGRLSESAAKQTESLQKVLDTVNSRVEAGRDLPITQQEANVNLLRAKQRLISLKTDREYGERNLAVVLGYTAEDTVRPAEEDRITTPVTESEEAAVQAALGSSKELKRLESNYQAKVLELKGDHAQRLPRIDLVAQYALLTRYSHYDEYFNKFQRNNGQIGASIQVPILAGSGARGVLAQAEDDQQHIRTEILSARNRIQLGVHQSFQEVEKAKAATDLAKAELDLAHAQLSVLLAQMNEGRASQRQVEEARFAEDERWIAFYDAQFNTEKARLNILKQTGELLASLQ